MPIRVVCPQGHKILAPESRAGQRILCPRCRSELRVPGSKVSSKPSRAESPKPSSTAEKQSTTAKPNQQPPAEQTVAKKQTADKTAGSKKQRWKGEPTETAATESSSPEGAPSKSTPRENPSSRKSPPPLPSARKQAAPDKGLSPAATPPPVPPRDKQSAAPAQKSPPPSADKPSPPRLPREPAAEERSPVAEERVEELAADLVTTSEESSEPATEIVGVRHRRERIQMVYMLAIALASLALFGIVPVVMEWYDYAHSEGVQPLARWTWFALGISTLQLAYTLYLVQLPDWSSVWSTAIATLGCAMLYAMLYAVTLLGDANSSLLSWLEIHPTQTSRAAGWCFVMLSISGIFAYFCGRAGNAWRHSEQLRASMGLK